MHLCGACVRVLQPIRVLFLQRPRTRKLLNSAAVIANRTAVAARALACPPTLWLGPHAHVSLASQMCRAINDGSLMVRPPGQDEEEEEEGEGGGERRYQARPGLLGFPQRACHICTGTGLAPCPHLHRDWARPCPHLHRDWARPCYRARPRLLGSARRCVGAYWLSPTNRWDHYTVMCVYTRVCAHKELGLTGASARGGERFLRYSAGFCCGGCGHWRLGQARPRCYASTPPSKRSLKQSMPVAWCSVRWTCSARSCASGPSSSSYTTTVIPLPPSTVCSSHHVVARPPDWPTAINQRIAQGSRGLAPCHLGQTRCVTMSVLGTGRCSA